MVPAPPGERSYNAVCPSTFLPSQPHINPSVTDLKRKKSEEGFFDPLSPNNDKGNNLVRVAVEKLRFNLRSWANDPESGLLTVSAVRGAGRDEGEGKRLICGR